MIQYIIPLVNAWLPIWDQYIIYFFALSFLAFCGFFIHYLLRR